MPLKKHVRSSGDWIPELQSLILRAAYNPVAMGGPAGRENEVLKPIVSNRGDKMRYQCVLSPCGL